MIIQCGECGKTLGIANGSFVSVVCPDCFIKSIEGTTAIIMENDESNQCLVKFLVKKLKEEI